MELTKVGPKTMARLATAIRLTSLYPVTLFEHLISTSSLNIGGNSRDNMYSHFHWPSPSGTTRRREWLDGGRGTWKYKVISLSWKAESSFKAHKMWDYLTSKYLAMISFNCFSFAFLLGKLTAASSFSTAWREDSFAGVYEAYYMI